MSRLRSYLSDNNLRQAEFAAAVGATQATISGLVNGTRSPSLDLAVRIERETKGAVPVSSWVQPATTPVPHPSRPPEEAA